MHSEAFIFLLTCTFLDLCMRIIWCESYNSHISTQVSHLNPKSQEMHIKDISQYSTIQLISGWEKRKKKYSK